MPAQLIGVRRLQENHTFGQIPAGIITPSITLIDSENCDETSQASKLQHVKFVSLSQWLLPAGHQQSIQTQTCQEKYQGKKK
jgi:hypothetical protein